MRYAHAPFALLLILSAPLPSSADAPPARSRTFDFAYTATVKDVPPGAKRVDLWLPVPQSDAHQTIGNVEVTSGLPFEYQTEPGYGNRVLHAWSETPVPASVTLRFRCTRREHRHLPGAPGDDGKPDAKTPPPDRFLQPDRLGVIDDAVLKLSQEVTSGSADAAARSRAVYDYVERKMVYDKSGTGWGRGDTRYACEVGKGNCTDFHALFISLSRAAKIPSRFEIGFSIPSDKPEGPVAGYHCWAEFWVPDFGWVPVDCSEGWKQKEKRDYFYGAHDENRVQLSIGRDLRLPGMRGEEPVNFFVYPYLEVDGKPSAAVDKAFAFRIVAAEAPPAGAAPAPGAAGAGDRGQKPAPTGLEFSVGEAKIRFYGFLRTDLQYDSSHPNNTQTIVAVRSTDPAAPAGVGDPTRHSDLTIHPRLTRFGVDVGGPAIAALDDARPSGKIEIDFYNNGLAGQSESRAAIRMRHAYVKLDWADASALAGQTADIISPLYPIVNLDIVMWGAGNLGDRRPMFMGEVRPKLGDGTLVLQGEVGLTGADDNQNLDGGTRDGEASGRPTLQARVAWRQPHPWVEKKTFEIGVWGHDAKEHLDNLATAPAGFTRQNFSSDAIGFDVAFPVHDLVELRGEGWQGKNLDDVRGGIFQGVSSVDGGTEIRSRGYWGEAVVKPLAWYALHLGVSSDDPVNSDIALIGAGTTAPTGAVDNHIYYLANRVNAGGGLSFGLDYLRWTTQWRGGLNDGKDNRFNLFVQYSF